MLVLGIGAFLIWRNRPPTWEPLTSYSVALASIVALFAGVTLMFGVHSHTPVGAGTTNPRAGVPESLANGQRLFEANCIMCHGRTGKGDGPSAASLPAPPPDLTQHVPYHNDGTLYLWITNGLPLESSEKRMPAFKSTLSDNDRWDIVNYLRHAFGSGRFTPVLPPAETPLPTG